MTSPLDSFLLADKAAIVTGAGSGIGRAIATMFVEAGARVAYVDLNRDAAEEAASTIGSKGRALAMNCDVSSEAATQQAVNEARQAFGALHILVNAAAHLDQNGTVVDYDLARWNQVYAVNVGGAFLMSKWCVPHLAAAGGGSIIHVASQLGSVGAPGRAAYCSTKGALIQLARAMAIDHAKDNIRVNTLSPGGVETNRLVYRFGTMEQARSQLGTKHVLDRLAQPDEIARAALFLASDASSFMTGADLLVDGGYNAV